MALNFPNSPSLNQTYVLGNKRWRYNGNAWILDTTVYAPNVVFIGSITSESFVGDGLEANVVLSNTFGDEAELLIFVDGVIQEPDTNYVVSGNTITFSSAPLEGSNVFVRYLATTNSAIITTSNVAEGDSQYFTNARVQTYLETVGNIIPATDEEYSLGLPDKRWKDIYLSGNTIVLGTIALKDSNGSFTTSTVESNGYIVPSETPVGTGAGGGNIIVIGRTTNITVSSVSGNITIVGRTANTDVSIN